jgi:hypothetical protein
LNILCKKKTALPIDITKHFEREGGGGGDGGGSMTKDTCDFEFEFLV